MNVCMHLDLSLQASDKEQNVKSWRKLQPSALIIHATRRLIRRAFFVFACQRDLASRL